MKKTAFLSGMAALLAVLILPATTLAVGYTLSPTVTGYSSISPTQASIICTNLPAGLAMGMPFCVPAGQISNSSSAVITNISASTGDNNTVVTWVTNEPTTTSLWYSPDPSDPSYMVGYSNPSQGFTTSHMITVAGLVPESNTLFQAGGTDESGNLALSAAVQFSSLPTNSLTTTTTTTTSSNIVPLITVSGISDGNATVNVNANAPVKAEITYGIAGQPATYSMYSSSSYNDYNPIYLTNLANNSNYQGQITVYDENGNTIGTYPVSWMTFQ